MQPLSDEAGGNRTTPHYLLVLSVSVTQHETVHLSIHRVEHIFALPLLHVDGSSMHADSHANIIPQQGCTPLSPTVPAVSDGNTLVSKVCVYCGSEINVKTCLLFLGSWHL